MVDGIGDNLSMGKIPGAGIVPGKTSGAGGASSGSFAEMLKGSIEEVARLQRDASQAVDALAVQRIDDELAPAVLRPRLPFPSGPTLNPRASSR